MRFFIALGSNSGDRTSLLAAAIDELEAAEIRVVRRSSVYETDPVGGPKGQPDFLNQVIEVDVPFGARELVQRTSAVETALGRDRSREQPQGPRTIDIDILLGDETVAEEGLRVPHPRMTERAFVLVPLAEIAPELVLPGRGSIRALLESVSTRGVRIVAK